ncbi:MAG: hypothetical protein AB7V77_00620 [Candidatus Woesearchaeota archaeon]
MSLYENLLKNAYDDNHGITFRKKDYIELIKKLKAKKKLTKSDKIKLNLAEKDLANFKPQWISVEDINKELKKNYWILKKDVWDRIAIFGIIVGLIGIFIIVVKFMVLFGWI